MKDRSNASKLYGVSKDLSNTFVFELDNGIFVYSSKDKDQYKTPKYNNIIAYIIVFMILDINETQIGFITGDPKGICNFQIFEKFGGALFDGLKVIKNTAGDVNNITNYKVLCYLFYMVSCMITKYNLWKFDYVDGTENKHKKNSIQESKKL